MTPEQLEIVIKRLLGEGVALSNGTYVAILIALLLAVLLGAFLSSYLQEKGKNQAAKEDLQQVLNHIDKTTRLAEEIKTKISSDTWLRQQIWSEKSRLYAEILQSFESVRYATSSMSAMHAGWERETDSASKEMLLQQIDTHYKSFITARSKVRQLSSAGQIVFNAEAWDILRSFRDSIGTEGTTGMQGLFDKLAETSATAIERLALAARRDLGFLTNPGDA